MNLTSKQIDDTMEQIVKFVMRLKQDQGKIDNLGIGLGKDQKLHVLPLHPGDLESKDKLQEVVRKYTENLNLVYWIFVGELAVSISGVDDKTAVAMNLITPEGNFCSLLPFTDTGGRPEINKPVRSDGLKVGLFSDLTWSELFGAPAQSTQP